MMNDILQYTKQFISALYYTSFIIHYSILQYTALYHTILLSTDNTHFYSLHSTYAAEDSNASSAPIVAVLKPERTLSGTCIHTSLIRM